MSQPATLERAQSINSESGVFQGDDELTFEEQQARQVDLTEDGLQALAVALEAEEEEAERKKRMRDIIQTKNRVLKESTNTVCQTVSPVAGSLPRKLVGSIPEKFSLQSPISGSMERSVGEAMGYYRTQKPIPANQIDFTSPPLSASAQAASLLAAAAANGSSVPKAVPLGSLPERYTVLTGSSLSKKDELGGFYSTQKPLTALQVAAAASPLSFSAQVVEAPVKPKSSLLSAKSVAN
jgi:hypothetical protein